MPNIDKIRVDNVDYDIGGSGGETLPVGTEVDFDGQVADIPIGWEQVSGKSLISYTLYENTSGSNSTITLSDDMMNYDYVDIVYGKASKKSLYVQRIQPYNITDYNFTIGRTGGYQTSPVGIIFEYTDYSYSNNQITPSNYRELILGNNVYPNLSNTNSNYIFKVIGIKEV